MIYHILADAVQDIDEYLKAHPHAYQGALRTRILLVRNAMEDVREEMDIPPSAKEGE